MLKAEHVEDAERLVRFASGRGVALEDGVVQDVIAARTALETSAIDPAIELRFNQAFSKLTSKLNPITVESIKYALPDKNGRSRAKRLSERYTVLATIVFALLFLFQGYWHILNASVEEFNRELAALRDYTPMDDEAIREATLQGTPTDWDKRDQILALKFAKEAEGQKDPNHPAKSLSELERIKGSLDVAAQGARRLAAWFFWLTFPSMTESTNRYYYVLNSDKLAGIQSARMLLDILNRYGLPILYGLLGAGLYIIKNISKGIREVTLSTTDEIEYGFRFFLGGAAGLAIAWFFVPTTGSVPPTSSGPTSLTGLSPLALAFVAGYAVELLFSVIDRVIIAFQVPETKGKQ